MGGCQSRFRRVNPSAQQIEKQQHEGERKLIETCLKVHQAINTEEIIELKPEEPKATVQEQKIIAQEQKESETQTIYEKIMYAEASTSPLKVPDGESMKVNFIAATKKISKADLSLSGQKTKLLFQRKLQHARDLHKEQRRSSGPSPLNTQELTVEGLTERSGVKEFSYVSENKALELAPLSFANSFADSIKLDRDDISKFKKTRLNHKTSTEYHRHILSGKAVLMQGDSFDSKANIKSAEFGDFSMIDETNEQFGFCEENLRGGFPEADMAIESTYDTQVEPDVTSEYEVQA